MDSLDRQSVLHPPAKTFWSSYQEYYAYVNLLLKVQPSTRNMLYMTRGFNRRHSQVSNS